MGLVASMASPRRVSRGLYLLGRGRRAAARGFAEPELAHEMRERVGEARRRRHLRSGARLRPRRAAADEPRKCRVHAREKAWEDYFDRENPQPMDERIGNEASLARMTALGAVEAVCYQLARAAGEVDSLGLSAAAARKGD